MTERKNRGRAIIFFLVAVISACILIRLGDADDSPGLGGIGILLAMILAMRGIYHIHVIPRGYHIPIILLILAVIALAFPIVLYIDGEIWGFLQMAAISLSAGAVMILIAVMRIVRVRRGR